MNTETTLVWHILSEFNDTQSTRTITRIAVKHNLPKGFTHSIK